MLGVFIRRQRKCVESMRALGGSPLIGNHRAAMLVPVPDHISALSLLPRRETTWLCGGKPEQLLADAGYCSEANLAALENRNIDAYVATGRARNEMAGTAASEATAASPSSAPDNKPPRVEAMRAKIKASVSMEFLIFIVMCRRVSRQRP